MGCVGEWYHTGISILCHCPLAAITLKYHWPSDTAQENLHQKQSWSSSTPIAIINWISTQSVYVKWTPRGQLCISVNALTVVVLKWSPEWQVISVQSFMSTQISKVWCQKDKIQKPQSRNRSAKGVSPPLPTPLAEGKFHLWTGGLHILSGKIQGNGKRKTLDKGKKVCTKPDFTLRQFIITIVENNSWKQELKTIVENKSWKQSWKQEFKTIV